MRALFVCARCPWPTRRGDQLRAVQFLEALKDRYQVTLVVPDEGAEGAEVADQTGAIDVESYRRRGRDRLVGGLRALFGGDSFQSALFRSSELERRLPALAADCDLAIVQLARLGWALDRLRALPVYVDLIDCLSLSFERRALEDRPWLAPLWRSEAKRLLAAERRILEQAAGACVVNERDRSHLAGHLDPEGRSRLVVVPLVCPRPIEAGRAQRSEGLDRDPGSAGASGAPTRLVLSGNLGYFPNRSAAEWFLRRVWPQLSRRGEFELVIAGARPGRRLRQRAREAQARLIASPENLFDLIRGADVALAPLRAGAGVPVKVLEAWAAGAPVVASGWAAAGVGGVDRRDLLVADRPQEWVDAVVELSVSGDLARRLAEGGRARLRAESSKAAFEAGLAKLLGSGGGAVERAR